MSQQAAKKEGKKKEEKLIRIPGISIGRIHSMGRFVKESELDRLCNGSHPLQVKVGKHEVFCIGSSDFKEEKHLNIILDLDVFFGLSYGWKKYEAKVELEYKNPVLQSISKKLHKDDVFIDNIILAEIPDRGIDNDIVKVIAEVLKSGKKIGFGCMAGHGRTGWVLAKLIKRFEHVNGDEAVKRVRERYCKKCVESKLQVADLGCKNIEGSDLSVFPSSGKPSLLRGLEYDPVRDEWKETTIPQLGIGSAASHPLDEYAWGDDYYKKKNKPMSSTEEWLDGLKSKGVASTVEDEENPDQVVDAVVKQNLKDAGYTDPAEDEEEGFQLAEGESFDDEIIVKLASAWEKWMAHEELTAEEQELIDRDLKRNKHFR